jgi:flavodoxin|tara:strand:+ start:833 stop:1315 length:483 start_codon:yes stop_codon:yes gene_type:complete
MFNNKKILVVYYSRHNNTHRVAELVAKTLGAKTERLVDKKDRSHLLSWFKGAFDEELKTPTAIQPLKNNPKDFDLIIIGTPIWDGICPAIKTFIKQNKTKIKKLAFFITFGASPENAPYIMEKLSNKKPITTLEIQDRQIDNNEHLPKIKEFCKEIKNKF